MNEKEVERSKAWFALSQTFIILAGFLFAAAGVMWTNSVNTAISVLNADTILLKSIPDQVGELNNSVNMQIISNYTSNAMLSFSKVALIQMQLSTLYIVSGIVMSALSIFFWFRGYSEIKERK